MSADIDSRFRTLAALPENWDGDGAVPPNETAIGDARAMLATLAAAGANPDDVDADVMGGIALYFNHANGRTLWIACHNHGTVVAVGRDRAGENKAIAKRTTPGEAAALVAWIAASAPWPGDAS